MCCAVQRCEALADYDVVQEEPKKTEKKEEPKKVSCTSRVALHASLFTRHTSRVTPHTSHLTPHTSHSLFIRRPKSPKRKPRSPRRRGSHHASLPITLHIPHHFPLLCTPNACCRRRRSPRPLSPSRSKPPSKRRTRARARCVTCNWPCCLLRPLACCCVDCAAACCVWRCSSVCVLCGSASSGT